MSDNIINVGRIRPVYKKEYNDKVTYTFFDMVSYNSEIYLAIKETIPVGTKPSKSDDTYWVLFSGSNNASSESNSPGLSFLGEIKILSSPIENQLYSKYLHIADGDILDGTTYSNLYDYMVSIKDTNPEYFTTEERWQNNVNNYGVCDKYVIDTENKTIRIPKLGNNLVTSDYKELTSTISIQNSRMYYYVVIDIPKASEGTGTDSAKLWFCSQEDYDAAVLDANTVYFIR